MLGGTDGTAHTAPSADAFAGSWRSVTPSLEFVRLSVYSKSSEIGVLASQLTLSGVAWEGSGRVDGDSLVMRATIAGTSENIGTIVVRPRDEQTLQAQLRPDKAAPIDLVLARLD